MIRQWFNESQDDEGDNSTEEEWWKKFYKKFLLQVSDDLKNKVDEKREELWLSVYACFKNCSISYLDEMVNLVKHSGTFIH